MAYNLESSLMQAVGNSVTPLLFLIFSSFLNIALDLLFMGRLGLGVGGAAAATVLSQGISAVLGLFHILRREPNLRLGKRVSRAPRGFVSDMLLTCLLYTSHCKRQRQLDRQRRVDRAAAQLLVFLAAGRQEDDQPRKRRPEDRQNQQNVHGCFPPRLLCLSLIHI